MTNQSAILVGPASTMDGCGLGEFIDSHDIVCRVGGMLPIPQGAESDLGTRTDVIYENFCPFLKFDCGVPILPRVNKANVMRAWLKSGVREIRSVYGKHQGWESFTRMNRGLFNVVEISPKPAEDLTHGNVPTKGFIALLDMVGRGFQQLSFCGFTFRADYCKAASDNPLYPFMRNESFINHPPRENGKTTYHEQSVEQKAAMQFIPKSVWLDPVMEKIIRQ